MQKDSFICPIGTIFNQQYFVCDWWFNFDCNQARNFYSLNAEIGVSVNPYGKVQQSYGNQPSYKPKPKPKPRKPKSSRRKSYGSNRKSSKSFSSRFRKPQSNRSTRFGQSSFSNGFHQTQPQNRNQHKPRNVRHDQFSIFQDSIESPFSDEIYGDDINEDSFELESDENIFDSFEFNDDDFDDIDDDDDIDDFISSEELF